MCYSVQLRCRKDAQLLTGRGCALKRNSALSNSALAACKRQLSSAWAENVSLVGAFEQTMQGQGELGCGTAPALA